MRQYTGIAGTGTWDRTFITLNDQENFTYDGNGNILAVNRTGATAGVTDNLAYQYNHNANGKLTNNQLNYLTGTGAASGFSGSQSANNYQYDPIGNITADNQSGVSNIQWSVYGKIQSLTGNSGNETFTYDPAGQRATKTVGGITTFYVRDAQRNTLAVYDNQGGNSIWKEQHLYGSSRIGMWQPNIHLSDNNATSIWDMAGYKQYELTNDLGNVVATVCDIVTPHTNSQNVVDYYLPDITTAQEYYAFGGLMPSLSYTQNSTYRYGFNGKENENQVKGTGNQQDYGERICDDRVARFLSVDPLMGNYPFCSSYQFAGNSPIQAVDLDGLEPAYSDNGRMVTGRESPLARTPLRPQVKAISYTDIIKSIKPTPNRSTPSRSAPSKPNDSQEHGDQASDNGGSGLFNSAFYLAGGTKWGNVGTILDGLLLGVGGNEVEVSGVFPETNREIAPVVSPIVQSEPPTILLDPQKVNFSQRTVSGNVDQYVADMKAGDWNWEIWTH